MDLLTFIFVIVKWIIIISILLDLKNYSAAAADVGSEKVLILTLPVNLLKVQR
jgi:hypothetical protein